MKLLTNCLKQKLIRNGEIMLEASIEGYDEPDLMPVVKLFTPDAACTWLLTELDPQNDDLAYGLCDLGMGHPELGYVCLSELLQIRGKLGLPVERDRYFRPDRTLSCYAEQAYLARHIEA